MAPVNNELPAPTAVWQLIAPGGCPQPGQAQLDFPQLHPQFPSPAALRDGTHPADRCRQEPGQDNAALVLSVSAGTGTSWGGTTLVLHLLWEILACGFLLSLVKLLWRDDDPTVLSPQGTSSTAWRQPAMTLTRSKACHHRHQTRPTHLATRSTAIPRAPSPAFPPATSTGRRQ